MCHTESQKHNATVSEFTLCSLSTEQSPNVCQHQCCLGYHPYRNWVAPVLCCVVGSASSMVSHTHTSHTHTRTQAWCYRCTWQKLEQSEFPIQLCGSGRNTVHAPLAHPSWEKEAGCCWLPLVRGQGSRQGFSSSRNLFHVQCIPPCSFLFQTQGEPESKVKWAKAQTENILESNPLCKRALVTRLQRKKGSLPHTPWFCFWTSLLGHKFAYIL